LVPYGGTNMGAIATRFGFFSGTNDDLSDSFFDRSVLRHVQGGRHPIEPIVRSAMKGRQDNPLLRMKAVPRDERRADVFFEDADSIILPGAERNPLCTLEFFDQEASERYRDQTVAVQSIFNWLSKVPAGHKLGTRYVNLKKEEWTWEKLGEMTTEHLRAEGYATQMEAWKREFARVLGYPSDQLPKGIGANPYYFCFFPSGPQFARQLLRDRFFEIQNPGEQFDILDREARHWLFDRALYLVETADRAIAK